MWGTEDSVKTQIHKYRLSSERASVPFTRFLVGHVGLVRSLDLLSSVMRQAHRVNATWLRTALRSIDLKGLKIILI